MGGWNLVVIAGALIAFAPFSGRLRGSPVTATIVFTVAGYVLGDDALGVLDLGIGSSDLRLLAEVTLAVVLFSDASSLDARRLRRQFSVPVRLLAIGLPLTIALGTLVAVPLFPDLPFFASVMLAVLLAPTDAALGQTVVSDVRLPTMLRQGLNVESGLNDGICVPVLVAAVAFAELEEHPEFEGDILVDLVKEVSIAVAVGAVVGLVVVAIVTFADRRRWLLREWAMITPLATAVVAYAATAELHGSGFIGAFVAGLVYGRGLGPRAHETVGMIEDLGQALSAATFLLFGAVMIGPAVSRIDAQTVVYALLSLTIVRMVPVALSLIGTGATFRTMMFAGWFGPRGLATIVFALTIVEESGVDGLRQVIDVATVVVALSVVAHGLSAPWLTDRYAGWLDGHDDGLADGDEADAADAAPTADSPGEGPTEAPVGADGRPSPTNGDGPR